MKCVSWSHIACILHVGFDFGMYVGCVYMSMVHVMRLMPHIHTYTYSHVHILFMHGHTYTLYLRTHTEQFEQSLSCSELHQTIRVCRRCAPGMMSEFLLVAFGVCVCACESGQFGSCRLCCCVWLRDCRTCADQNIFHVLLLFPPFFLLACFCLLVCTFFLRAFCIEPDLEKLL
jgi:hypothetical protein